MAELQLVTGATGLVGHSIVTELLARGHSVRTLVRDVDRARGLLPEAVELVAGDVTDAESVARAMAGCETVYHAAGLPEQWHKDPSIFERVNLGGTMTVGEAALANGVRRFVYTSTIDVFQASSGETFDESTLDDRPKGTHYERSKQEADRWVAAAIERGLAAVFIHPAAVYGPGPAGSPGVNQLVTDLCRRKVPALLPGGMPLVSSTDVGRGHVLAAERPVGSRYILCEGYYSLREIAQAVAALFPAAKVPRTMPMWAAQMISGAGELASKVTRRSPLLPRGQLHFLRWGARPSGARAERELGLSFTPLEDGLEQTLAYLGLTTDE